jgi:hypothetical protein
MSRTEKFIIDNVDRLVEDTRVLTYNMFGQTNEKKLDELSHIISELKEEEVSELNSILSQEEAIVIANLFLKKQVNKTTLETRTIITNESYQKMIEAFNDRMVSNILHSLVNKGLLETAYDAEDNDFVFWAKDDEGKDTK